MFTVGDNYTRLFADKVLDSVAILEVDAFFSALQYSYGSCSQHVLVELCILS